MTTKLPSTKIWVKHLRYDCLSTFNYIWSMNGNLHQYIINIKLKVSIFTSCHYQMINTVIFNKHTSDITLTNACIYIWLNLPRKYKKIHVISFFALLMIITWTNWLFVLTTERNSNSNLIAMLQLWRWNYLVQLQCPIVSLHETRCVT